MKERKSEWKEISKQDEAGAKSQKKGRKVKIEGKEGGKKSAMINVFFTVVY